MRADGDLDQAGGGGHASIYGQEITVNKLGLVRSLRNTRPRQGTIAFCGTFSSAAPGERSVGRRGALNWHNVLASESGPDPLLWSFPPWRPVLVRDCGAPWPCSEGPSTSHRELQDGSSFRMVILKADGRHQKGHARVGTPSVEGPPLAA